MKKYIVCLFAVIFGFSICFAQVELELIKPVAPTFEIPTKGLSSYTALLLMDLKKLESQGRELSLDDTTLCEKYGLFERHGDLFVNTFLVVTEDLVVSDLYKARVEVNSKTGASILTARIPVNAIEQVANIKGVQMIQIGERANLTMDVARSATLVNSVHQGYQLPQAYFGNAVVVGVIDIGFDYTHPNFYDTTGENNYRIKRVWEQNATTGTPPAGFQYGRELTNQNEMLAAQRDMQNQSHGTHVAGTAAGSGVISDFMGVAPQSELVLVSTTMQDAGIADAIAYIIAYADATNKPCVINMSLGKQMGPHDGNSLFDLYCDQQIGQGKILVGAAGNDGDKPIHISKSHSFSDDVVYSFVEFPNTTYGTNGIAIIDIWGDPYEDFEVSVALFNTHTHQYEDWTPYVQASADTVNYYTLFDDDLFFPDVCNVTIATSTYYMTNKRNVMVYLDHTAQDDNYRWAMIRVKATTGHTKMWSVRDGYFTSNGYSYPVISGSTNTTVSEIGGTGNGIISVGAYTTKNTWTDLYGGSHSYEDSIGAIAPFSSRGATADGRIKPDITAPGNIMVSSVSSFDPTYSASSPMSVYSMTNGTNYWRYGTMSGTSMASPMVTGIIALWLEANPELTPTEIKQIIKDTAITDSYTGTISTSGNTTWGWGKINAHQGLLAVLATMSTENHTDFINQSIRVYPNPTRTEVTLSFSGNQENVKLDLYDSRGKLVKHYLYAYVQTNNATVLNLADVANGVYILKVSSDKSKETLKIVKY